MSYDQRLNRWLYAGGRPNGVARALNSLWARLSSAGAAPSRMATLEVVGRRSGRTVRLPMVVADLDGSRYLVSMLGEGAGWVANVRAAGGHAVLRHRQAQHVVLREVPVGQRAPCCAATSASRRVPPRISRSRPMRRSRPSPTSRTGTPSFASSPEHPARAGP